VSEHNGHLNPDEGATLEGLFDELADPRRTPEQVRAIRQRISAEPSLRRAVHLQQHIDLSLRGAFAPPVIVFKLASAEGGADRRERRRLLIHRFSAAAIVVLSLSALASSWLGSIRPTRSPVVFSPKPVTEIYAARLANGFQPDWVCSNDEEFRRAFSTQLGQEVSLSGISSDVEPLGMAYSNAFSYHTVVLLARAHGREVMVFVDQLSRDPHPSLVAGSGLYLHRREAHPLVYYELSPLETAQVLPLLSEPTKPPEHDCSEPAVEGDVAVVSQLHAASRTPRSAPSTFPSSL
jgi:hypothetical protein